MLSERDWEETGGGDEEVPGGSIPGELNRYIEACAAALVATAWHPYRSRPFLRLRLWKLSNAREELTERLFEVPRERVQWDLVWIPQ
jgi:hypothetical protein